MSGAFRSTEPGNPAQDGLVLLSVIGLLMLLSLLASEAATTLMWQTQTARHWARAAQEQTLQRQWLVDLYGFDPSFLTADVDSATCHALGDSCVYFAGSSSAADTWLFTLVPPMSTPTPGSSAGTAQPAPTVRGWLRRHAHSPSTVAAIWIWGQDEKAP